MNIRNWSLIDTNRNSGNQKVKCPICSETRKNKQDRSLMIWHNIGVAKCYNDSCNSLFFKENIEKSIAIQKYTLPVQDWKNHTELSDKMVKYFEGRKINQFTLKNFNITEEQHYQPQLAKTVNNVVFNYFEGETLVNKKYRSANKKFTQTSNGKPIFYNINSIIGCEEIYIVEGEIETLSLSEIGIYNVVSVPNGANDNDNYWINSEKYISGVKKFYIATDNDESGNNVAEKIAQRLGRYRCERIVFEGKDANEDLISGVLEKSILNRIKYPVSGSFTTSDLVDKMNDLYDNGLPYCLDFKNPHLKPLNEIFRMMLGHLVVGTGIPSHGKSCVTEWMVLNLLLENELKASFFSPEHQPLELHMSTFCEKVIGKNFFKEVDGTPRISKDELNQFNDWANQRLYLTSPENGVFANWDWVFDKFKEQMITFGINIFVVDAWNKVEHTAKRTERENIGITLSRLTQFAQQNNVMIIVIAHPTKMKKEGGIYDKPTLYDVSGSADFRNQTHDGYCIYRFFGEDDYITFTNLKTKYNFQGKIGEELEFKYHKPSGRIYLKELPPQVNNLLQDEEAVNPIQNIKYEDMQTAFYGANINDDDEDEISF